MKKSDVDNTLSSAEAAKVLGVSVSQIRRYVQKGALPPVRENPYAFDPSDVEALAQARSDTTPLEERCLKATILAQRADRRVTELMSLLRIERRSLEPTRDAARAYQVKMLKLWRSRGDITMAEARELALLSLEVTPEYLSLLSTLSTRFEPWKPTMKLLHFLHRKFPTGVAGAEIGYAARNMHAVAFHYVHDRDGVKAAKRAFPKGGLIRDLGSMMF